LNKDKKQFNLRKSLVVFQFVLSIIMIISTGIAFSQMQYIQNKNLGFNEDHLIVVDINSGKVRAGYNTIKENYAKLTSVKNVSVSSRVPGEWKVLPHVTVQQPEADPTAEAIEPYFIGADEDFLATFEIELLKGRSFDLERADSTAVMINESAAKLLGIEEPGDKEYVINKINFDGMERDLQAPFRFRVVGITKDFHFQSLHEQINPLIIGYRNNPMHRIDYFTARVSAQDMDATIAQMETILHSVDPGHLFEYHFLDDQLQQFYENDQRRSSIFSMAALLAIFIACLGLFGLSAFAAEQRTKEIGIRKVLGASIVNLISLLSKDFLRLVGIAIVIAIPLAWYIARRWLQNFAYSVDLSWWMFIVPGMVAILIALLTVSFQSVKVAVSNPVKALRWE
jgi:putative ABC transport system permease protein